MSVGIYAPVYYRSPELSSYVLSLQQNHPVQRLKIMSIKAMSIVKMKISFTALETSVWTWKLFYVRTVTKLNYVSIELKLDQL